MRESKHEVLTDHLLVRHPWPQDSALEIKVLGERGAAGAPHIYQVFNADGEALQMVQFQDGPIRENGVNGITIEVLLAICADQLRSFQAGQYSCKENACALTHIEEAQNWLNRRTLARIDRGVEGTSEI